MSGCVSVGARVYVLPVEEPDWSIVSDPRKMLKWSKTAGCMAGSQKVKAVKLCNFGCIQYIGGNVFVSLPLDTHSEVVYKGRLLKKVACDVDYNRDPSPYEIHKLVGTDEFVCSCQWNSKFHLPCSHILALKLEFKRKKFGRGVL